MAELAAGIKPSQVPEKPEALVRYEQCRALGLPLVDGGLYDQPHIWVMEYGVVHQRVSFWENYLERQRQLDAQQTQGSPHAL